MSNNAPADFINICGIAGISKEKTQEEWLSIWEKAITEYLFWLLNENDLSEMELRKLDAILTKVINKEKDVEEKDIIKITAILLEDEEKKRQAITKFAEIFVKHYIDTCQELEQTMSLSQKQVISAYSKVLEKTLTQNG